jgi:uncharacterized protein
MLIEFRVGNFRSFRDVVTLSLAAAKTAMKEFEENNVIRYDRYRLLRCAAVFGANASGKSNLLSALAFMRWFVINSSKEGQAGDEIPVTPFKLDTMTEHNPSLFEVTFLLDKRRYRYGFEADHVGIHQEWLLYAEKLKENLLFHRDRNEIHVSPTFPEGKGLEEKTRENALFLSVVANFNGKISRDVLGWFSKTYPIHGTLDMTRPDYRDMSVDLLRDASTQDILVNLISEADLGIRDIRFEETATGVDLSELEKAFSEEFRKQFKNRLKGITDRQKIALRTTHTKFEDGRPVGNVEFDMIDEESDGTLRFFDLLGPILKSLLKGQVVFADELESSLHPLLMRKLIQLYQSSETNPNNAQLVFTTHNTNMLSLVDLRRDQIWFTEKNEQSATELYSIAEFKREKVRKDAAFEKNYLRGRYGAIPFVGDFDSLVKGLLHGEAAEKE